MQLKRDTLLERGKYRILATLGQGGFGITYLAEQALAGRKVCIKEYFPKDYYNRDADTNRVYIGSKADVDTLNRYKEKFIKEASVLARLKHPHIVSVYDVFEENDTAYYVMEHIEGESLGDVVKRRGALDEATAVGYIRQIADALGYIHAQKINHLDVKPGNVMVSSEDDSAILIDFGLAKHYDTSGGQTSSTPVGISHGYAPFEQYKSGGVSSFSPATDIYSLGATLYYLVTGEVPPSATDIGKDGIKTPDNLSPGVQRAIKEAMNYWREERPQSVKEFLKLLDDDDNMVVILDVADDDTPTEKPITEPKHKLEPTPKSEPKPKSQPTPAPKGGGRKWLWVMLFVALIVVVATFFVLGDSSSKKEGKQIDNVVELYNKGVTYYNKSDYTEAVKYFKQAAEEGYADAQYYLGYCYRNGYGVTQDYNEAVKWYRKAAEQGNAYGQNSLGYCYQNGYGVTQDYNEAVNWYRKAAEQGNAPAQNSLGDCYRNGYGVTQDYNEAVKWYRKAAEQGNATAQNNLGYCYLYGVTQDYNEAVKWYRKATEQGDAYGQNGLGYCYLYGYGVTQNYDEAVNWYRKAAEQGNAPAQSSLGYCYENGYGVTKNIDTAVDWYRKAARQGHESAQNNLKRLGKSW